MPPVHFTNLLIVVATGLLAPLALGFFPRLRLPAIAAIGFAVSFAIALALGLGLRTGGFVRSPLFVAIVLVATSLGVIVPVLKDSNRSPRSMPPRSPAGRSSSCRCSSRARARPARRER